MNSLILCVDFDGTICTHEAMDMVGEPVPHALDVLHECRKKGDKIILWTMRSGKFLLKAVEYVEDNGIKLWGVNQNPTQFQWTNSPKAYGHLYIDDLAAGCPLQHDPQLSEVPFVDWLSIRDLIEKRRNYFDQYDI